MPDKDNQETHFALHFMLEHPEAAVKVLESGDLPRVAEFIESVPENYLVPVLKLMMPEFAARLASYLPPAKTALLLEELEVNAVSAILRLSQPQDRVEILAELPESHARSVSLLLDFSPRTVGAWMTPHSLCLPEDARISEAWHYLKQTADARPNGEFLYLIDRDNRLCGKVDLLAILKSNSSQPITSLLSPECVALPGQMQLEQAMEHKAWHGADSLPVVSRQQEFLGVITHSALRKGLSRIQAGKTPAHSGADPVSSLFEVYGQSLLALFNTVSTAVDKESR